MHLPSDLSSSQYAIGALLLVGVLLYALLGGADFGGGVWDFFARGPRVQEQRKVIARAIGPVWEANHVWLIFVIVLVFTCFPSVFSILATALYVPFTLALLGIVFRGAAFVFRAHAHGLVRTEEAWGRVFAIASVITPVIFGMCAGAVSTGDIRVVNGTVVSSLWTPWLSLFPLMIGLIALTICAYLAAVYLTMETEGELQEDFRRRAIWAGRVFILLSLIALPVSRSEAPHIWSRFTSGWGPLLIAASVILASVSGWAVLARRFALARLTAAAEVAVLLGGWALAQYPYLVVADIKFTDAAASPLMLKSALITYAIGAVFLIPSLFLLFSVFKGLNPAAEPSPPSTGD